ncbi:hypothetical protein [Pseudorhodoferax soli]|uniref:Uncharacterized protein n=1 Tax=Pseudorhodoferax soli TaxID=545864 RepID=A0A368XRI8_9BURK|nr:hypothetical protein [Pseudorhodoferax soli]RCW70562.1 hypothetical protein DES41_105505 [Pseudorhodoferax soli]
MRFPRHVGAVLMPWLQPGTTVHARGWGSRSAQGSALEATAMGLTAESMQELYAGPAGRPGPPVQAGNRHGPGACKG